MMRDYRPYLTCKSFFVLTALALLLTVTLLAQNRAAEPSLQGEGTLKVMTYNMYVGASYAGITSPDLDTAKQAGTNLMVEVTASDPAGRADAIARQIVATMPHLVSLQEVATWSTGTTRDNLTLQFDYLQLLLSALNNYGAQYTPLFTETPFDATFPSTTGFVRNTWRLVILGRADLNSEDFSFTNGQGAPWSALATLSYPLPAFNNHPELCPVSLTSTGLCIGPFPRGWASVDLTYREKQFRFIGAHLESASSSRNIKQGLELLNGPAKTSLPVIIAADLNCDLSNPADGKYQTCINFLNAGFVDSWNAVHPAVPGFTKDLPEMTMRGDYVMARGRFHVQAAVKAGEEPGDMTTSGLWASNHCGVVARLQLPGE